MRVLLWVLISSTAGSPFADEIGYFMTAVMERQTTKRREMARSMCPLWVVISTKNGSDQLVVSWVVGVPPNHPFKNHHIFGILPWLWKPPVVLHPPVEHFGEAGAFGSPRPARCAAWLEQVMRRFYVWQFLGYLSFTRIQAVKFRVPQLGVAISQSSCVAHQGMRACRWPWQLYPHRSR